MQKSKLLAVFATASTLAASVSAVPVAQAATQYSSTHIYLNGQDVTNPVHTAALDPSSGQETTFMPIFYAMQVLKQLGIQSSWDSHTWSLTVPSSMTPNMSSPSNSPNQMVIAINGTVVQTAPKVVAVDPASNQQTTFIPIFYLSQVLDRLGVTSTWDGTNWRLTKTTPETQTAMASAMWNVFNATTWDVNTHPTMAQSGVDPTNAPATAGDVATWLADWAGKAKGVTGTFGSAKGQWIPYNLKYEASSDPYTWANVNGLYQGTGVTSASSVITPGEVNQIVSNLQWWLTGDHVINGVSHLHVPFYSNYGMWLTETGGQGVGNGISEGNYQSYLADETRYYDEITAKVQGTTIDLTLPNTTNSTSNMAWDVVDGQWEYGGWQSQDNRGGKTIQVPNAGAVGMFINSATLNPNMYLEGFQIGYLNVNGVPMFFKSEDAGVGQHFSLN
ncbi:hypothetical protein LLE49_20200 [Alicyclobacillus tolerans]|uniref:hypothetical protein n=1 Tax=Alicyclobacillus tolerans TaxID=90970 RepID=UPI001F2C79E9|nr:hypothetical protein [Alicyclobacillus tolerans]MCF8567047.1 hypothetical protein [Alicyclobacillus tolerans]